MVATPPAPAPRNGGDVSGFRFKLAYADGEDAGEFVTAVPDWHSGDVFRTGDGRRLRILSIVPLELVDEAERAAFALWEVEPV